MTDKSPSVPVDGGASVKLTRADVVKVLEQTRYNEGKGTLTDVTDALNALLSCRAAPVDEPKAPSAPSELSFKAFSRINRQRCESETGFNHKLDSWSMSDWFLALIGEIGEAANVAKKLNRYRDGIPGNKVSKEELQVKLRNELGDAFVYLDLLAQSVGVAIEEAASEVFDAKSEEIGCPIRMLAPSPAPSTDRAGDKETSDDVYERAVRKLISRLNDDQYVSLRVGALRKWLAAPPTDKSADAEPKA
jgi:NTP pyrophosphatase (non-canonical NTP hydrolase)